MALRIFFRRVEIAGAERVSASGPVIFVLNHPNGLVDPAFMLCLAPRPVSFLAKSPLFRMPIVGYFVRALNSIPVYRRQDAGEDPARNRETFARCRDLLSGGGSLAICPEGVSHNDASLRPLKTGTARIALGAVAASVDNFNLKIVPVGLYYTSKTKFRSSALVYYGEPICVPRVALDANAEPPPGDVRELSSRIETALREVVLNAEHDKALSTVARAERIFSSLGETSSTGSSGGGDDDDRNLERELKLRRRFVEGYEFLRARAPHRLEVLDTRIARYEAELEGLRLEEQDMAAPAYSRLSLARYFSTHTLPSALIAPLALAGLILHYPAYKLTGTLATRLAKKDDDVVSTFKIAAAMLFFPLTWLLVATIVSWLYAWPTAVAVFLLMPLLGYTAILFFEEFDRFIGGARALAFFFTRRWFFLQLLAERRAIRDEIVALGSELLGSGR
ncbi:MAG: lysophospholipid acyltransferase family protein [Pyrinomonadaceae bacterium]